MRFLFGEFRAGTLYLVAKCEHESNLVGVFSPTPANHCPSPPAQKLSKPAHGCHACYRRVQEEETNEVQRDEKESAQGRWKEWKETVDGREYSTHCRFLGSEGGVVETCCVPFHRHGPVHQEKKQAGN